MHTVAKHTVTAHQAERFSKSSTRLSLGPSSRPSYLFVALRGAQIKKIPWKKCAMHATCQSINIWSKDKIIHWRGQKWYTTRCMTVGINREKGNKIAECMLWVSRMRRRSEIESQEARKHGFMDKPGEHIVRSYVARNNSMEAASVVEWLECTPWTEALAPITMSRYVRSRNELISFQSANSRREIRTAACMSVQIILQS